MDYHEAANIFPLDEEGLDALAADLRAHGQQVPIETLDGLILDGRRRWLACQRAGLKPTLKEVATADPVQYVFSLNYHRRHLTPAQRSMCAARATALREKLNQEAKKRQKAATARGNKTRHGREAPVPECIPKLKGEARDAQGKGARLTEACMAACRVPGFDAKRLLAGAERCRERLVPYATRDAYLDLLETLYNWGRKQLVGLKALAVMALRERRPAGPRKVARAG